MLLYGYKSNYTNTRGTHRVMRHHGRSLRLLLGLGDALSAAAVFVMLSELRLGHDWLADWRLIFNEPGAGAGLLAVGWVVAVWSQGLYRMRSRWSLRADARAIAKAALGMALVTFALLYLVKLPEVSRSFVLLFFPVQAAVTLGIRAGIRWAFAAARERGLYQRNLVIVGSGSVAANLGRALEHHPGLGLRITGYVAEKAADQGMPWPYLGTIEQLEEVFDAQIVDEVAICLEVAAWETIGAVIVLCEERQMIVRMPLLAPAILHAVHVENLGGMPVLSLFKGAEQSVHLIPKRAVDLAVGTLALLLALPLFAIIATMILLDSGRPIFFAHERLGRGGRPFKVFKFRTMVPAAEAMLDDPALRARFEQAYKIVDDPRVAGIGRWLRRTSFDELPQLVNVLRGEMSLVGPRPMVADELTQKYGSQRHAILAAKPGMTGLWQISGRSYLTHEERLALDLEYIRKQSFMFDLSILLRTVPIVLRAEGR